MMEVHKLADPLFSHSLRPLHPFLETGQKGSIESDTEKQIAISDKLKKGTGAPPSGTVSIGKVNLDGSFNTSGNGEGSNDDFEPSPTKFQQIGYSNKK
jgi:hypothetical protein